MMQTHGTTFVPTDYRVLGRWPDSLTVVWQDWKQRRQAPAYEAGGRQLNELALAQDLPFGFALSLQTLGTAGFTPLQVSDILATVDFL